MDKKSNFFNKKNIILIGISVLLIIIILYTVISLIPKKKIISAEQYDFCVKMSTEAFPDGAYDVVIVSGKKLSDSFSSVPFASKINAPILIVEDELDSKIDLEIRRLSAQHAYIIGGEDSVSEKIEERLGELKLETTRISGDTSIKTSLLVADELNPYEIFIVNDDGVDAANIASSAAKRNFPIIFANSGKIGDEVIEFIKERPSIHSIHVVGNSLSPNSLNQLKSLNREIFEIYGSDRKSTNALVNQEFLSDAKNIMICNDVLNVVCSSQLASAKNAGIIIVDDDGISDPQRVYAASVGFNEIYNYNFSSSSQEVIKQINWLVEDELEFSKNHAVFYIAHPNDDVLYFSQAISSAVDYLSPKNVHIVMLTDGENSAVKSNPSITGFFDDFKAHFITDVTDEKINHIKDKLFIKARKNELIYSLTALGAVEENINFLEVPLPDGNLKNHTDDIKEIIKSYDLQFGGDVVHFTTTAFNSSVNRDKATIGAVLNTLYSNYTINGDVYFVAQVDGITEVSDTIPKAFIFENKNADKILSAIYECNFDWDSDTIILEIENIMYEQGCSLEEAIELSTSLRFAVGTKSAPKLFDDLTEKTKNKGVITTFHVSTLGFEEDANQ